MEKLLKYMEDGIDVRKNNNGTYTVFTIPTQHFEISSLKELTEERFEKAIEDLKKREEIESEMLKLVF